MLETEPDLVPVAKGNGYGFTVPVLARAAAGLGVDQLAVGTAQEATAVLGCFAGDVIILEPHLEGAEPAFNDSRIVRTATTVDAVRKLAGQRMIIDCRSSLLRQGLARQDLALAAQALGGQQVDGFSLHLPLDRPASTDPADETRVWVRALGQAGFRVETIYVSHLSRAEIAALERACPGTRFRPRIGTQLWLGAPDAVEARATVLDAFPVQRGDRIGYRQNRSRQDGWVVVVSGGTVQGVGLEAPRTLRGLLPRAKELLRSGLAAANRTRSPFTWKGRKQWFAEPPHMLVSMLYLPRQVEPPEPGSELCADLRHTSTHFDQVVMR
ncbi:alanine racemase [Actinocrinis puniceicyclus]|uniref:Alanine racemase n=1 Tax=Actinocrinis puniceicyclus TaxID=977794 RepID=A0A8J7WT98_9ACTN|nr:alanine racemase [Actinocrinis puniceicyclus]